MTPPDNISDLVMKREECPKCGAVWINNRHVWSTGNKGDELDLAGLVCNTANSPLCINPKKGLEGGDTWAERAKLIERKLKEALKDQT